MKKQKWLGPSQKASQLLAFLSLSPEISSTALGKPALHVLFDLRMIHHSIAHTEAELFSLI